MLNFIKKHRELRKIKQKLQEMKLRADISRYKQQIKGKSEGKWDRLNREREDLMKFTEECAEDYQAGGWDKLLQNPVVQDFVKALISKMSGTGITPSDREKKVMQLIKKLPPDVVEKAVKALK